MATGLSGGSTSDMFVLRCLPDGTPDDSFGFRGAAVFTDAAGIAGRDEGHGMVLDGQGRIVVAGLSSGPFTFAAVWRFTDSGVPDTTFGGQGFVLHAIPPGVFPSNQGEAVTIDASGRILSAGFTNAGVGSDLVVWRFLDDGSLDPSFSSKGWVQHGNAAGGNDNDAGFGVVADSEGGIIVCGSSQSSSNGPEVVIWRFHPPGILDGSFGTGGVIVEPNPAGGMWNDSAWDLTIDSQGRLVVVGHWFDPTGLRRMVVWRYL
ncbi:MAG: hypothetical protein O7H41_11955 [Planctomycetota bacterium]|nr:hypothetical protein [Planctomycetota bacterium]